MNEKQDSVYACRSQINTVLQLVKSCFYNIAISFSDNPVVAAMILSATPFSLRAFAIRIFSSLRPSTLPSSRPLASPLASPSARPSSRPSARPSALARVQHVVIVPFRDHLFLVFKFHFRFIQFSTIQLSELQIILWL